MCLYTLQRNESFAPLQREKWSLSTLNTAILFCTHTQAKSVPSICLLLFTSSVLPYSVQYTLKMKLLPQSHSLTACFHCLGNIGTVAFIFPKMHTMGIMYVTCITYGRLHISVHSVHFLMLQLWEGSVCRAHNLCKASDILFGFVPCLIKGVHVLTVSYVL